MSEDSFGIARLKARMLMPYLSSQIMSLTPVKRPGLGTAAVDQYLRVYYDPQWLESQSVEDAAFVILHECMHPLFKHHIRARGRIGERPEEWQCKLWNLAGDACINEWLENSGLKVPQGAITPATFNLAANGTVEERYDLLLDKATPEDMSGKGEGGDGEEGDAKGSSGKGKGKREPGGDGCDIGSAAEPGDGDPFDGEGPDAQHGRSGSGSDGVQKPWENGAPSKEHPGLEQHDQESIERQVAKDIKEFRPSAGHGDVPACWKRFAREILEPEVDPTKELAAKCKHAVTCTTGFGDHTYQRPHRRTQSVGVILPSHIKPLPRVKVIVDTSGSMGEDDLALALGVVGQVCRALPDPRGVEVIAGDTRAAACSKVFRPEQVTLAGGGGTDMGAILEEVARVKPAPTAIFVLTDGETGWPARDIGIQTVACMTRRSRHYSVPGWIQVVELHKREEE